MIILGTNSIKDTGYDVANSLRTNRGSSDYLNKTFSGSGNRRTFTISFWLKIAESSSNAPYLCGASTSTTNGINIYYNSTSQLSMEAYTGAWSLRLHTSALLRDTSAWYHICYAIDTTQGTEANRVKLYINGVQQTFSTSPTQVYPSQNLDLPFNQSGNSTTINCQSYYNAEFMSAYYSEFCMVDGQALDPTSFGEFDEDSGIWKPIDVSGLTFGTNGFYLDFENSGSLGADVSGNGNNFTVNNLTAIDQSASTCTNNEATLNPLAYRLDSGVSLPTYSDGNTTVSYASDGGAGKSSMGTICFDKGKWYWEYKVNSANDTVFGGITRADYDPNDNFAGRSIYYNKTGALSVGTGTGGTADGSYGNSYTTNDIIGVAFDCDNGVIWFSKNGTWQNSATQSEIEAGTTTNSATTGITLNQFWSPFLEGANSGMSINFGSPAFAISSGNTDGNGYGNFEYAVPSGYYSLNTKNLSEYG